MRKLILAALSGSVLVLTLTGCVAFQSPPTVAQQDIIGKVRVSFTVCASERTEDPAAGEQTAGSHDGCPDQGNSGTYANDNLNHNGQLLVAFRVPVGTATPSSFSSQPGSTGPAMTLVRNASYTAALQLHQPPPSGQVWAGYMSAPFNYDPGAENVPALANQFVVDLGLPVNPNGAPFASPFRIRPVVGIRSSLTEEQGSSRPVECGDNTFGGTDSAGTTDCIESPDGLTTQTDISVTTRALGIAAGAATVSPGQSVTLPFDARLNGTLPGGTTFAVSATTDLPGVTARPSVASFTPAAGSSTRITVPITVPKGRGPGQFKVGVTATLPNGQARTGTAALVVRDTQKPKVSKLKVSPKTLRPSAPSIAVAGARVSYRSSEAAKVRFTVQRCRKAKSKKHKKRKTKCRTARGSFTDQAAAGSNRFRFTGFLRNKALKPGSYKLVGVATDPAKNKGKAVKASFRIKK